MLIGYARASTTDQSLEEQIERLKTAGCQKVYQEKQTKLDRHRVELEKMLQEIQMGETLLITSPDCLVRSSHDLFSITRKIEAKGASFKSLNGPWADSTNTTGKFLFTVFRGLFELEQNLVKEGCLLTHKRGTKFGRKNKLTPYQQDQVSSMIREGQSIRVIARHFNVGVATIDRIKKKTLLI